MHICLTTKIFRMCIVDVNFNRLGCAQLVGQVDMFIPCQFLKKENWAFGAYLYVWAP